MSLDDREDPERGASIRSAGSLGEVPQGLLRRRPIVAGSPRGLISPFEWGDRFYPTNFPERNRIMARLAKATVTIEASDTSGSLHQAAESIDVGHPVFIAKAVVEDTKLRWPRIHRRGEAARPRSALRIRSDRVPEGLTMRSIPGLALG